MMEQLTAFLQGYLNALSHNIFVVLVLLCVAADTLFGCLRAVRYRCWNSAVGIDGGIRKVSMVTSVVFLALIDRLVGVDLMGFMAPDTAAALGRLGVNTLGLAEFFAVVYILYEASSILKNLLLCGAPGPKGLQQKLAEWVDTMTDESSVSVAKTLAAPGRTQIKKNN